MELSIWKKVPVIKLDFITPWTASLSSSDTPFLPKAVDLATAFKNLF